MSRTWKAVSFSVMDIVAANPFASPEAADRLFIRLFHVAELKLGAGLWNARDVCSGYWRMYVNDRDGAWLGTDTGRYDITPDAVHLVPAWVRFSCHNDRAIGHLYAHFDVVGLPGTLVRELFREAIGIDATPTLGAMADQLRADIAEHGRTAPMMLLRAKAMVCETLAAAVQRLPESGRQRLGSSLDAQHPVAPALAFIDRHLGEPITNADLAERCHLSEDHFIKVFRESVGQTPGRYVLERRIAEAGQLLTFTHDSIEQIAESVGFANRFHFSRAFSRRMGLGPATYRKNNRV